MKSSAEKLNQRRTYVCMLFSSVRVLAKNTKLANGCEQMLHSLFLSTWWDTGMMRLTCRRDTGSDDARSYAIIHVKNAHIHAHTHAHACEGSLMSGTRIPQSPQANAGGHNGDCLPDSPGCSSAPNKVNVRNAGICTCVCIFVCVGTNDNWRMHHT
jgi:hypothetical protein